MLAMTVLDFACVRIVMNFTCVSSKLCTYLYTHSMSNFDSCDPRQGPLLTKLYQAVTC